MAKGNRQQRGLQHGFLVVRTCPVCKKTFVPAPEHVYRLHKNSGLVCTYSCLLKGRRAIEEKKKGVTEND